MPKSFAAIFDWDGVIIDSSAFHRRAWDLLAQETGRHLPSGHFERGFGKKNEVIIPEILEWTSDAGEVKTLADRKEEIYREALRTEGIAPMEGVIPLLESLHAAAIPCGVGTSTPRENIRLVMELTGLELYFSAMVTAEDVRRGKPDPDVFLQVASRLKVSPVDCVVFEDALVGIAAAHHAGMKAVGVASTNPIDDLQHADCAVKSLMEINIPQLAALFTR